MNSSTPDALGTPETSEVQLGRRGLVMIAAVSALLLLVLARALGGYLTDDTYIFLRYARNIAEGNGAVFNLGERVEGFTSPLWTFLLAGLAPLCANLETLVTALSLACGCGVVVLLCCMAGHLLLACCALLFVVAPLALLAFFHPLVAACLVAVAGGSMVYARIWTTTSQSWPA